MRRLIGSMTCCKYVACWGLLCVCWWGQAPAANAVEEAAPTLATDANESEGPILVGYEATIDEPTSVVESASHAAEPLPTPAAPRLAADLKPVVTTTPAPVVTDVIMLIDATQSMACPSGRERRMAIAQWSALDVADGIPENIPAAFVALHDEATALRQ